MKKNLQSFICALASLVWCFSASAEVVEFACGATASDNVKCSIDTEAGVMTVSGIGNMAAYTYDTVPWADYKTTITSGVVEEGITNVGGYAFYQFSAMTKVSLPSSVTSIDYAAFSGCTALTGISLPENLTSIGDYAFSGCNSLTAIEIPEKTLSFGKSTFQKCLKLTQVKLPSGIKKLSDNMFYDCTALTELDLPEGLETIGGQTFNYTPIVNITLPSTLKTISRGAFYQCNKLKSIVIPKSVTYIGAEAFYQCTSVETMIVEDGNTKYDSRYNCNAIIQTSTNELIFGCKTSTIPKTVERIGKYAFYRIPVQATYIVYPYSVKELGNQAYYYGNYVIKELYFGAALEALETFAYYGQKNLTKVVSFATVAPSLDSSSSPFMYTYTETKATLYYPKGSDYTTWASYFKNMEEIEFSGKCGDNLSWEFDTENYMLKISGSGAMTDYAVSSPAPWNAYAKTVETILLADEQTTVSDLAFDDCLSLAAVIYEGDEKLTVESGAFDGDNETAVLYVKEGTKDNYSDLTAFADVKEITLTLDADDVKIGYEESVTLTPTYSLAGLVGDVEYTWTSTDAMVVEVKDGVVTPVNPGTADVKVSVVTPAGNTLEAVCKVTVVDAATGIDNVKAETMDDGAIYDLLGRKVVNPATGVYIKNGKKLFIVK